MADISLLFDVAGGGSLSGESGKQISSQLTEIVDKINQNPFKIKIEADDKSLEKLKKEIEGIRELIGNGGILKIDSSEFTGMARSVDQISGMLQRMMGVMGSNSVKLSKFSEQLQNIFEAIPENSNLTTRSIEKITKSFSDLVDKVDELNVTVDQINNKRFSSTIYFTGAVQESAEQIQAYREYLLALMKDFNSLQGAYRHLQANITNPKYSAQAFTASAAVASNKRLLENIQNFNYEDMKAQAGIMDLGQLKQAAELYQSLIASMMSIRTQSGAIFKPGNQTEIEAARQKIQEVEQGLANLESGTSGENTGESIFDFVDKVREGLETLHDPIAAVKSQIDSILDFSNVSAESEEALKARLTELTDAVGKLFSDLRGKIAEELNFSTLSDEGDKALIERIRTDCTTIEERFDQLRDKIVSVFDMSEVPFDVSSITDKVDQIQESLNGLTLSIGNVQAGGSSAPKLVTDKRNLKDLIPDGVKISDTVSDEMLKGISTAMQSMQIAEGDAGRLTNLFKNLSGTVTEVTTRIVDQGTETERLKNVTIKGVDEAGQAFTRSADYVLKHSKKQGDYIEGHVTTTRKQVIAEQERAKAAVDAANKTKKAEDASAKSAEEEAKRIERRNKLLGESFALLTQIRNLSQNEKTLQDQADALKAMDAALAKSQNDLRGGSINNDSFASSLSDTRLQLQEIRAELALVQEQEKDTADDGSESLERRNKLLSESYTLLTQIRTMASKGGLTEDQSSELKGMDSSITSFQKSVREGNLTNKVFAESLGKVRDRIKELRAETAGAGRPVKILTANSKEFAEASKNIQASIGNARSALENFTAAEKSSNESSRNAYAAIGRCVEEFNSLNDELQAGTLSEDGFKAKLSQINGEVKKNTNIIRENGDAHKSLRDGIKRTIQNFSQWLGVSRIMMAAVRSVKQMVTAVIELDTAMTELRKVTDETDARYDRFLNDAAARSKQVGASLSDTVLATADFARLGYTVDQAEKLADAAIIYKNVGDGISDISEASESIIATMQAFNIAPESVMSIVDKFNEVGNNFAISSSGVGEALLRSASALHVANNSLEESIGLAAAANTIVQNPQIVGTTLKTVSMYLRAAKTELQEAGEETEGIAESTSELRELILQVTRKYGEAVDIMSDDNTFKSTYEILREISQVWDKITDEEDQASLLKKLGGGVRNGNTISALLENFDIAEQAMTAAQDVNALGSAVAENEKVLESIQGRINLFKSSFEDLSRTIVDGELVKFVVDAGTWLLNLVNGIGKAVSSLGGLRTILTAISGISIAKLVSQLASLQINLGVGAKVAGSFKNAFAFLLGGGASEIANGLKNIASAIAGPQGIVAGATILLTTASAAYSLYKKNQEEVRQVLIASGNQAAEDAKSVIDLYDSYTKLATSVHTNADAKSELDGVTKELLKRLGIEEGVIEGLGDKYEGLSDKIKSLTLDELYKKRTDIEGGIIAQEEAIMNAYTGKGLTGKASPLFTGINYNEVYARRPDSNIIKALKDAGYGSYLEELSNGNIHIDFGRIDDAYDVIEMLDTLEAMKVVISKAGGAESDLFSKLSRRAGQFSEEVDALRSSLTDLDDINRSIDQIESPVEKAASATDNSRTIDQLTAERDAYSERAKALEEYISAYEDLIDTEKEAADAGYSDIAETQFGNIDTNNRQILDWTKESIDKYREVLESWGYTEEDLKEMLDSFSTVMGTSMNFDGLEIAFSPILQTEDGPVLLNSDTVERYISGLIRELAQSGKEWTDEDIFRLDTRGLEIDGITVRNLLAGIGDDAIRVGEVMHFAGSDGALADAFVELRNAANRANVPLGKFRDNIDNVKKEADSCEAQISELNLQIDELNKKNDTGSALSFSDDITTYAAKLKILSNTWKEYRENGLITSETYQKLNKEFEDESGLVEIVNGKLSLNAEAVEKLNDRLRDEYGLKIALAGASEDEIAQVDNLAASLRNLSATVEDPTASLKELTGVLTQMHEGYELSTFDTLNLIQKYPQLRDKIISTAKGYQIEEAAIRELIAAKSQLLTLNEREIGVSSAREALVSRAGSDVAASKIDKIFSDFEAKNGRRITSIEDFASGYLDEFGRTYEGVYEQYDRYVNALIDVNNGLEVDENLLSQILNDVNNEVKEGYDPTKKESSSSSSASKEETAFEKAYKLHQHYLEMNQETEEQYLNWLDGAYKASYAAGEMELDDYYKYEEEVYEKRQQLFQTSLDETQHQIDLLSHRLGDTSEEQIALYEQMQKKVNAQANSYRAQGIRDNDELIRELQNQWWQYEDNIRQLRESSFNDWLSDRKFVIEQLKQDKVSSDEILNSWKSVLERIKDEIAYYSAKGYDITTDVIQNLMKELESAKEAMIAELDDVVAKANEVVDGFQNIYTTLTNAAKEYASTGYLSVDSLQAILVLGPKYMTMLDSENGQLVINEQSLQKIIAARTDEMAAETALSYAKQVLLATEQDEVRTLRDLAGIQAAASSNIWEQAYATLGYARALGASKGISDSYYASAIANVEKMQSVAKTAADTVSDYYKTLNDGYVSQADGLETILKLTQDMIKQENSDRVDALEKEKDLYKDIIDEKKEILRLSKEQDDHDRDMADKLKEIADLQSKIDQLALDDSREATAQRTKLEAQLLEKQKALADDQADYAYDAQVDSLDKQYDAYEKVKDDEIDGLKKELDSAEKLYGAAIDRITNGWDTLYDDLINWNYNYGSTLQKDLETAWTAALEAAERYGDFVSALDGVKEHDKLGPDSADKTVSNAAVQGGADRFAGVSGYINRMRANSLAWFTSDNPGALAAENKAIAKELEGETGEKLSYNNSKGVWTLSDGRTAYSLSDLGDLTDREVGHAVVSAMKANSAAWGGASESERRRLEEKNNDMARRLSGFLGKPITKSAAGVWMIGGERLYDIYHRGGIVGGRGSVKQNEVMALLEKGEAVLDERRESALYKTVDFVQMLSNKIGHAIDKGRLSSLLAGTGRSFPAMALPALAGGVGTMNFAPTVQVTIAGAGDLSESTARKYGSIAADTVLEQLKSAFTQRGVSASGNSILK